MSMASLNDSLAAACVTHTLCIGMASAQSAYLPFYLFGQDLFEEPWCSAYAGSL